METKTTFSMIFMVIIPLLLFLLELVASQSQPRTPWNGGEKKVFVNQISACEEYEKCLAARKNETNTVRIVRLGENAVEVHVDKHICAYKSNCRKVRRALCEKHMVPNGSVEMKVVCQVTWLGGSNETDATDPITASNVDSNQIRACSNYEKCRVLPDEGLELLGLHPFVKNYKDVVKMAICADITNCRKVKMGLCNNELVEIQQTDQRLSKLATLFCSITWYKDEDDINTVLTQSRSLGGEGLSKSQLVLAQICPAPIDGVCSLF